MINWNVWFGIMKEGLWNVWFVCIDFVQHFKLIFTRNKYKTY